MLFPVMQAKRHALILNITNKKVLEADILRFSNYFEETYSIFEFMAAYDKDLVRMRDVKKILFSYNNILSDLSNIYLDEKQGILNDKPKQFYYLGIYLFSEILEIEISYGQYLLLFDILTLWNNIYSHLVLKGRQTLGYD